MSGKDHGLTTKLFLVLKDDSWDRSEVVGIFSTLELAKEAAEEKEPDRVYEWEDREDYSYASCFKTEGPIYTYNIEYHILDKGVPDDRLVN